MKTRILCLDIGTKTGYAFTDSQNNISSGTYNNKPKKKDGFKTSFKSFKGWLEGHTVSNGGHTITQVFYEKVERHKGTYAAHMYGGFLAILFVWCEENNITYESVGVGTIKKFITGKGNAKKEDVIKAVKYLGHKPKDDNEADALALLYYARHRNLILKL